MDRNAYNAGAAGYTRVELSALIGLMLILAAVAVPRLIALRERAENVVVQVKAGHSIQPVNSDAAVNVNGVTIRRVTGEAVEAAVGFRVDIPAGVQAAGNEVVYLSCPRSS